MMDEVYTYLWVLKAYVYKWWLGIVLFSKLVVIDFPPAMVSLALISHSVFQ